MILVTKKAQISLIKKRDGYKCASCYERCKTKDLDVYQLEESSKKGYITLCKTCLEVVTKLGTQESDIPGRVSFLKNKAFIDRMLALPPKRRQGI